MPEKKKIKIAKFMSECGVAARRKCEEFVTEGRVRVNGRVMMNVAERIDPAKDVVKFARRVLTKARKATFILHKPKGYVSTMSDPKAGPTLAELIPPKYAPLGLKPVGRLDRESEGLMLLTNDGAIANRVMHPRYGVPKVYLVTVSKPVPERILKLVGKGIRLPDREKLAPMRVRVTGRGPNASREIEATLKEGKKHEIRRAFAMFGYDVQRLRRVSIGPIKLGAIRKGRMAELSDTQLKRLRKALNIE